MSDVIRDVLIRVAVQQVQGPGSASGSTSAAPNPAPVIEAAKKAEREQIASAKRVEQAQTASARRSRQAAEREFDEHFKAAEKEINRLLAAQEKAHTRRLAARERLAAFNRRKAQEEAQAEANATLRQIRSRELYAAFVRKKNEEMSRDAELRSAQEARAAAAASNRARQSAMQAAAASRELGESFGQVIRAITLLSASGDKDLERLLHKLVMIQGAIDLYKGAVGLVTNLTKAYQSLAAAASAAAAAQSASAAATRAGAAGSAAGGAKGALGLLASRLGVGAAAFGVGALAGYALNRAGGGAVMERIGIYGTDPTRLARQQSEASLRAAEASDNADNLRRNASRAFLSRQGAIIARLDARFAADALGRDFDLSEADIAIAESQRAAGRARSLAEQRAAAGGQSGALALRGVILRRQGAGIDSEVEAFNQQRQAAQAQVAGIGDAGGTNTGRLEARKAALEAQQEAERKIVEALGRQREHRQRLVDQQRQAVELAKDQLQAEKDRVATVQEALGSLNSGQVAEIKRINRKVAGGGAVSDEELAFLEQTGGGAFRDFTGEQRRRRGETAFGADLSSIAALTGGSQVAQRQRELDAILRSGQQGDATVKLLDRLAETRKREAEALQRLADSTAEIGNVAAKIDRIRDDIELLTKRQDRRAQAQRNL